MESDDQVEVLQASKMVVISIINEVDLILWLFYWPNTLHAAVDKNLRLKKKKSLTSQFRMQGVPTEMKKNGKSWLLNSIL